MPRLLVIAVAGILLLPCSPDGAAPGDVSGTTAGRDRDDDEDRLRFAAAAGDREVDVEVELDDGRVGVVIDYAVEGPVEG
jgi:hypothetical protein